MGKHAIIVIKNSRDEYLQYFDKIWNSYLFLNCKLETNFLDEVIYHVSQQLDIDIKNIEAKYIGDKIHTKFSEKSKIDKQYHHYFYEIKVNSFPEYLNNKEFVFNGKQYYWYSMNELEKDERIQKVNSDVINYVKEFKI